MTWFKNLKISRKLSTGFALIALIAVIVGIVGLINLFRIGQADQQLYKENTVGIANIGSAEVYYQRVRFNIVKAIMSNDTATVDDSVKKIKNYTTKADDYLKTYEATINSTDDQNLFNALKASWEDFKPLADKTVSLLQDKNEQGAKSLVLGDLQTAGNNVQTAFDNMFQYNIDDGKVKADQNNQLVTIAAIITIGVIVLGSIAAMLLGSIISRIISNPIKRIVKAADKLALGEVEVDIDIQTKDEVGELAEAFKALVASTKEQAEIAERVANGDLTVEVKTRSEKDVLGNSLADLVNKLNQILETIVAAADQVASGSNMISNSSMALSQGASEQASSIQELTASMEEISAQVLHNAESAKTANDLAKDAEANAVDGNTQMKDMLAAMADISESSSSINKIIKVIDDIAFQTNILALNAAVEAARAGQHGKGFAVVAEEVRSLAARSANAAKETTELIESSIRKVEAGTTIASSTADALNRIVEQVEKAAMLVSDIATASSEQSSGIEQVNQGITQISQVVQTNAATSEESAAASEELSSQSLQLKEIVSIFKLKQNAGAGMAQYAPKAGEPARKRMTAVPVTTAKISLNDGDFGKY